MNTENICIAGLNRRAGYASVIGILSLLQSRLNKSEAVMIL